MNTLDDVKYGWDFMAKILGADVAGHCAYSDYKTNTAQNEAIRTQNEHIEQVNRAIDELQDNINNHPYRNLDVERLKGFIAEEMHAGTFNIEAIRQGSNHRAQVLHENGYATVDIGTNFGKNYGLKYTNTPKDAERMQATLNPETQMPKYHGQERLIAAEQVEEAKVLAHKRGLKNLQSRPDVAQAHMDTEKHLVGKISDSEGVESKELNNQEAKQIAREAKNGNFDPEKHGYGKTPLREEVRIEYVNRAINAGLTAAAITAITQIVPELYKAIDYLIKHGEIDLNGLKKSSKKIVSASGEAFLRGSIAYTVEMGIQQGMFGNVLKQVSPSVIGAAVTVIFGTIKDSILVAAGKLTAQEMGSKFVDAIMVSSGYIVGTQIGGVIAQALCPQLPGISFAIGSLIGCSLAVVYNIGKKKLISFCVDTGFTCFGLVEQTYELPEDVLRQMGVHYIPIPRTEIQRTNVSKTSTAVQISTSDYETIDITVLRRGIIGVNRIGYVMA